MDNQNRSYTLDTFKAAWQGMIGTNDSAYGNSWSTYQEQSSKDYSKDEIKQIINSGDATSKIELSRNYFRKDGLYRRILLHYATLMKFQWILVPNPSLGLKLSNNKIQKRYHTALDFIESMALSQKATEWSVRAVRDGAYYGVIVQLDKEHFSMLDLPTKWCRSRFKDHNGNNLIEFNVAYFNSIMDGENRKAVLATYPNFIARAYTKWSKKQTEQNKWCLIPSDIGICFKFLDGIPMFLNVIPATIDYDTAVATENERAIEEIRKIIVQKVPHLSDGRLLFEPPEAAEMHSGAVGMMRGNKNISVLTTYADVEGIVSKTAGENSSEFLKKMAENVYNESGASGQLFASNSNLSLETSIKNDMALMMLVVRQFNVFITGIINSLYANSTLRFKFEFLPITWYNDETMAETYFKMANSGYSYLMPALAMGMSQRDLVNVKELENDVMKLQTLLVPLQSAYNSNASQSEGGAPTKKPEDKSAQTIANQKSLDQGGL